MATLDRPASDRLRTRLRTPLLLLLILAAGVLPRVPLLANADLALSSDEAVNALVVKRLLEQGEFTFFNWDATYFGIVEGLLAIPFVAVVGFEPLAFKLAALLGFLLLQVAVFLLGRRLHGTPAGLVGAALLILFSPQLVQWSTLAAVGYCLMVAWGTLTLLHLDRLQRRVTPAGVLGLGAMIGFGLYLYELYLVYAILFGLWAGWATAWLHTAKRPVSDTLREILPLLLRRGALFAAGFALGWAPKLHLLLFGSQGSKAPSYDVANLGQIETGARLFAFDCLPIFLGINPRGMQHLWLYVGPDTPLGSRLGWLVLLAYLAAGLWGIGRARRELAGGTGLPRGLPGVETLLVLLPPLAALLFVLSPNSQGALANRFLLPWLSSLPVLAGGLWSRLASRSRLAAAAALLFLLVYPAVRTVAWSREQGYLDGDYRIVRRPEQLEKIVSYLERQGIRGAYGWYWASYKATLLSDEKVIVAPLDDWDRYPPYTRYVDSLRDVAYLFHVDTRKVDPAMAQVARWKLDTFRNRLESAGVPYEVTRIGSYEIYRGKDGHRLLPPTSPEPPVTLRDPRAEVTVLGQVPRTARPGETLRIPVRVTNRSDGFWSATGDPMRSGALRVTASYHWYSGPQVLEVEGERSLLPGDVRPGESMSLIVRVKAPVQPGPYDLVITLVHEGVAWFDLATGSGTGRIPIEIVSPFL